MAYVADYEYEIFISYPMEAEAWTKRFATHLQDGTELPLRLLCAASILPAGIGNWGHQ